MIRLFRVFIPASVVGLLVSEAILIFFCYALAAFLAPGVVPEIFFFDDSGLLRISIVAGCVILGIYFHDLYWKFRIQSKILLVQQICLVLGMAFLVQATLTYAHLTSIILPKWIMIIGSALMLILLPCWRILYEVLVLRAIRRSRLLFLGWSPLASDIVDRLAERPEMGLQVVGYLSEDAAGNDSASVPLLGELADIRRLVPQIKPDRIIVGMPERRGVMPVQELLELRFSGIIIEEAPTLFENAFGRVPTKSLRPSQLIFTAELGPRPSHVAFQSLYNFFIALAGAVITLPLMVLTAVLVRVTSPGPILFRQSRVGRSGRVFTLYKFRSMYRDAEARTGAVWARRDDPRITPVGRWLRKLRLDELPQLFNVLRGDMSIVGPRPERPEFVEVLSEQIPYYRQRLCVKPGITGWAQINHKYGDTLEDTIVKLEYDLYYIKNLAFSLDLYIMFQTMKVMLLFRGAQ
jgi:exopolysaccharide biosynthesis polyprenyl glycosylphosphotransferase